MPPKLVPFIDARGRTVHINASVVSRVRSLGTAFAVITLLGGAEVCVPGSPEMVAKRLSGPSA